MSIIVKDQEKGIQKDIRKVILYRQVKVIPKVTHKAIPEVPQKVPHHQVHLIHHPLLTQSKLSHQVQHRKEEMLLIIIIKKDRRLAINIK
jgi:hypothetical protein